MTIVVEELAANGRRLALYQSERARITIGREYSCDVALADPYADPIHATLELSEEGFVLTDTGSVNGTRIGRHQLMRDSQTLESGQVFTVGKTILRVIDPALAVEPARNLTALDNFYEWAGTANICGSWVAAAAVFALLSSWLRSQADSDFSWYAQDLVGAGILILGIASFWGLVGRISRRRAYFRTHLTIAAIAVIVGTALEETLEIALFNFNLAAHLALVTVVVGGVLNLFVQALHLHIATAVGWRLRAALLALIFCLNPGLDLYSSYQSSNFFVAQPDYTKIVIPPALQIKRSNSTAAFLQNSGALYAEADGLAEKRRQELVEQKAEQDARREG